MEHAFQMGTKVQHRPEYAPIPRLLRQIRESIEITQEDLAKRLKWVKSAVQKSEAGDRRVDLCEFVMWARACGADPRKALDQYLAAVYPSDRKATASTIQFPWEVRDEPLRERDEQVVDLLAKASLLLEKKSKKSRGGRKAK